MTQIRIPTPPELAERLTGLHALLTARRWERAAIVFAYTEVGEVGAGRWRKPEPPRLNIREFARLGYAGLTSNKSVLRYRDAWITAIGNGWAVPVEPGQTVELPEQPFPAWPYGSTAEDEAAVESALGPVDPEQPSGTLREGGTLSDEQVHRLPSSPHSRPWRPLEQRVLANVGAAATALRKMAEAVSTGELSTEAREQLVSRLTELRTETDTALAALQGAVLETV